MGEPLVSARAVAHVARYGWLPQSALEDAGCLTVAIGVGRAEMAAAFGLDLDKAADSVTDVAEDVGVLSEVEVRAPKSAQGSSAQLVAEYNGVQGSRDLVLKDASRDGKAASVFWNVNGLVIFGCARRGKLVISLEFAFDDLEGLPASLRPYVELARGEDSVADLVAVGAAMVAKFTGVEFGPADIDEAGAAYPILAREEGLRLIDEASSGLRSGYPELVHRVSTFEPQRNRALARWLTVATMRQTGVLDLEPVQQAMADWSGSVPLALTPPVASLLSEWDRASDRLSKEFQQQPQRLQYSVQLPDGRTEQREVVDEATQAQDARWELELTQNLRRGEAGMALRYACHADPASAALGVLEAAVFTFGRDGLREQLLGEVDELLAIDSRSWPEWPESLPLPPPWAQREAVLEAARAAEHAAFRAHRGLPWEM